MIGSQTAVVAICFGLLGPFQTMSVCTEIKQKQPQDRKTIFETLSLPVAKILSPVARQAPTKCGVPSGPLFVTRKAPPPSEFVWVPFSRPSQEMRHTHPKLDGVLGGGQKVYVEKCCVAVSVP